MVHIALGPTEEIAQKTADTMGVFEKYGFAGGIVFTLLLLVGISTYYLKVIAPKKRNGSSQRPTTIDTPKSRIEVHTDPKVIEQNDRQIRLAEKQLAKLEEIENVVGRLTGQIGRAVENAEEVKHTAVELRDIARDTRNQVDKDIPRQLDRIEAKVASG